MLYSGSCSGERRVHVVRRHNIVDDAKTLMAIRCFSKYASLIGMIEALVDYSLSKFQESSKVDRYSDCLSEAVIRQGYMCGVLSV